MDKNFIPIKKTSVIKENDRVVICTQYEDNSSTLINTLTYMTYNPLSDRKNYFEEAFKMGIDTFKFVVCLGDSNVTFTPSVWVDTDLKTGENIYNFVIIKERLDRIIHACPYAKIILQILTGAPISWLKRNKGKATVKTMTYDGEISDYYEENVHTRAEQLYPSISSPIYREFAGKAVGDIVKYCESEYPGRIFGYSITGLGTEEWYHHGWHTNTQDDYSKSSVDDFRQWLIKRYGSISSIRKYWNKGSDFKLTDIIIPDVKSRYSRGDKTFYDIKSCMNVVDHLNYYSEIVVDTIEYFCSCCKRQSPNKITMAFYGFQFEVADPSSGMFALEKYLSSRYIDALLVTSGYLYRYSGKGADTPRSPLHSALLKNKAVIVDNDCTTSNLRYSDPFHLATEERKITQEKEEAYSNAWSDTPEKSIGTFARTVGYAITNGFLSNAFDRHGGQYSNDIIKDGIRKINQFYKDSFNLQIVSQSDVLILSDELSYSLMRLKDRGAPSFTRHLQQDLVKAMSKAGVEYTVIALNDLPLIDCSRYKIVFFLDCFNISRNLLDCINMKLKSQGKVLVFQYAAGLFSDFKRDAINMEKLTGISFNEYKTLPLNPLNLIDKKDDEVISAIFNEPLFEKFSFNENKVELFKIIDNNAFPLAFYSQSTDIASAYKKVKGESYDYTTIYIPTYSIGFGNLISFLRGLCKYAGVHIFTNLLSSFNGNWESAYDTVYASKNILVHSANKDGKRKLTLRNKSTVKEYFSDKLIGEHITEIDFHSNDCETKYFVLE